LCHWNNIHLRRLSIIGSPRTLWHISLIWVTVDYARLTGQDLT
jgi:hypothetical protein